MGMGCTPCIEHVGFSYRPLLSLFEETALCRKTPMNLWLVTLAAGLPTNGTAGLAMEPGQGVDTGGKQASQLRSADDDGALPRPQPKDSTGGTQSQGGMKRSLSLPSAFCNSYGLGEF